MGAKSWKREKREEAIVKASYWSVVSLRLTGSRGSMANLTARLLGMSLPGSRRSSIPENSNSPICTQMLIHYCLSSSTKTSFQALEAYVKIIEVFKLTPI